MTPEKDYYNVISNVTQLVIIIFDNFRKKKKKVSEKFLSLDDSRSHFEKGGKISMISFNKKKKHGREERGESSGDSHNRVGKSDDALNATLPNIE